MRRVEAGDLAPFRAVLDAYNQCFYDHDLAALRSLYASDGGLVCFDNHKGCGSVGLDHHLAQVATFFRAGEMTENGGVEPLSVEDLAAFAVDAAAVTTAKLRYASATRLGVRVTFVLQNENGEWRIRHAHFSFDPNELD